MGIDYDRVKYVTNRKLENEKKEQTGKITMFSYDEKEFFYKMKCPFCGTVQKGKIKLGKRPFYVPCEKCGRKSLIKRLKG